MYMKGVLFVWGTCYLFYTLCHALDALMFEIHVQWCGFYMPVLFRIMV
jgi:hypothetical protein